MSGSSVTTGGGSGSAGVVVTGAGAAGGPSMGAFGALTIGAQGRVPRKRNGGLDVGR